MFFWCYIRRILKVFSPSEEVTKTWIKKKGLLIRNRPAPSRFSLVVCLSMIAALVSGFLGGFITAGFSIRDNYSSVYEGLLAELESTRLCLEREKNELKNSSFVTASLDKTIAHSQIHEQAIFSVFNHAVQLFIENNKNGGCTELNNILNHYEYSEEWRSKAQYLLNNNCR